MRARALIVHILCGFPHQKYYKCGNTNAFIPKEVFFSNGKVYPSDEGGEGCCLVSSFQYIAFWPKSTLLETEYVYIKYKISIIGWEYCLRLALWLQRKKNYIWVEEAKGGGGGGGGVPLFALIISCRLIAFSQWNLILLSKREPTFSKNKVIDYALRKMPSGKGKEVRIFPFFIGY